MKVGVIYRERIVDEIKDRFSQSKGVVFFSFSRLSALQFNRLRNELNKNEAYTLVTKNSLIDIAFTSLSIDVKDFLSGSLAMVYIKGDDIVKPIKILFDFIKENEDIIEIKGGIIEGNLVSKDELEQISKLPSREVLLGMAVSSLASPLTGFINILNQMILSFIWVVEAIKKKKEEEGA